jgi:hypothetical protein
MGNPASPEPPVGTGSGVLSFSSDADDSMSILRSQTRHFTDDPRTRSSRSMNFRQSA